PALPAGVKRTLTLQEAPPARGPEQVVPPTAKLCGSSKVKLGEVLGAPPVFVSTRSTAADWAPRAMAPKSTPAGDSAKTAGRRVKVAAVGPAPKIETRQLPVPLQPPPLHEVKSLWPSGVATRFTLEVEKLALQPVPQSMPAGLELTLPS